MPDTGVLPPLLLLHGALGAASQFEVLAEALRGHASVHRLDFEGHGSAGASNRPFRMAHFADNVLAYLDARGLARVPIFGYSMGGYVALTLAAAQPSRVARVMTLGTKFAWTPEFAAREGRMLDPRGIEAKVPAFARTLAARHPAGWEQLLGRTREMMESLGASPGLDEATLAAIPGPVRVVVGDRDHTVSVEESATMARALAAGELEVLPATPHPLERVSTERLARSIAEFLLGT